MKIFTRLVLILLAGIFSFSSLNAQKRPRVIKPIKTYPKKTNLAFGVGLTKSVLFLSRNVKENNDATGYHFSLAYGGAKILRTTAEFSYYKPINIEPTWSNIHANTFELNAHILARFQNTKAYFYPLFGLSYNHFSGFFTGKNDFLNLSEKYKVNTVITTNWVGVNMGTGYEHHFGLISIFADYKMRIGVNDGKRHQLNIMDVCISGGVRYNFRVPSIYKLFSGTRNRYILDTEKS